MRGGSLPGRSAALFFGYRAACVMFRVIGSGQALPADAPEVSMPWVRVGRQVTQGHGQGRHGSSWCPVVASLVFRVGVRSLVSRMFEGKALIGISAATVSSGDAWEAWLFG